MKNADSKIIWPTLKIDNMVDLRNYEGVILERIRYTDKGGILYTLHPFLFLKEIGVALCPDLIADLKAQDPRLNHLDVEEYMAAKAQKHIFDVKVRVAGLFRRTRFSGVIPRWTLSEHQVIKSENGDDPHGRKLLKNA